MNSLKTEHIRSASSPRGISLFILQIILFVLLMLTFKCEVLGGYVTVNSVEDARFLINLNKTSTATEENLKNSLSKKMSTFFLIQGFTPFPFLRGVSDERTYTHEDIIKSFISISEITLGENPVSEHIL